MPTYGPDSGDAESVPLAGGMRIARNVTYNIAGQVMPMLVAFFCIPQLIHMLGTEKFGVLALAWVLAGYFGLFDLGLGRAVVRSVVDRMGDVQGDLFQVVWSAALTTFVLGAVGGLILFLGGHWLTVHFFDVGEHLHEEVRTSLSIISFAIPFIVSSAVLRGVLEAFQKFQTINLFQIPIGALTYLLPLLVATQSDHLPNLILTLALLRVALWMAFFVLTIKVLTPYSKHFALRASVYRELLSFGMWISMSNLLQPFLSYMDRFLIGSMLSLAAVAYYTAPMEMVLKIWIIPGALISVIYPTFASLSGDKRQLRSLFKISTKSLVILLAPISLILSVFAPEILRLWIGTEYESNSGDLLRVMALGIFANCLGFIPASYLQAMGRPSVPARLHVVEFPIYAVALYFGLSTYGLIGTAVCWSARVVVDLLALTYIASRDLSLNKWFRSLAVYLFLWFGLVLLIGLLELQARIALVILLSIGFPPLIWFGLFSIEDQRMILGRLFTLLDSNQRSSSDARVGPIRSIGIAMAVYKPIPELFWRQLESVRMQDFPNWFCVVAVDSPDDEALYEPRVQEHLRDPRFIVVKNSENIGLKRNFEKALALVVERNPDAVAFSDQDDIWNSNKLSYLASILSVLPKMSLVHSDMQIVRYAAERLDLIAPSGWSYEGRQVYHQTSFHFLFRNCVTGAASLFDADLARSYGSIPDTIPYHDQWFALVASAHGGVYPIAESTYKYVQHHRNAVGVVHFYGILYSPQKLPFGEILARCRVAWLRSEALFRDVARRKISIPKAHRKIFELNNYYGGSLLIIFGILHLRCDGPLARCYLINGVGRIFHAS